VEILVCDGGSVDGTLRLAEAHGARIVPNSRRTAEAGKAEGIRAANEAILAFVDSDNEVTGTDWLRRMVAPFADPTVVASEVIHWEYVRGDGLVNRYCALTGINDPSSLFVGNYGRWSWLTGRWTDYPVIIEQRDGWQRATFDPAHVPTMGANGFLVRAEALRQVPGVLDFLFDIDAVQDLVAMGHRTIARVDVAIRHQFARNARDYARKTRRRAHDYLHHRGRGERRYKWPLWGLIKFVLATILIVPLLIQVVRGMRRRPDAAWLFHPVACWITLAVYVEAVVRRLAGRGGFDRSTWRQ
jgi:glycosyltransferase involved in cell wall biosynthesis